MLVYKKIRPLAVMLCICMVLSLCACRSDEPTPPQAEDDPSIKTYEPYVMSPPTFTEDTNDYRAMALAVFEGVDASPADHFQYEVTNDGSIRLTAYTGVGGAVILPDTIEGKPVTTLGEGVFKDSESLTALSIPESVTKIEKDLLTGCRTIKVLRTPQLGATRAPEDGFLAYFFGADTYEGMGFKVPSSLDTVILHDTVTTIAKGAFIDCSRLRMVLLPDTLTDIQNFAFFNCAQLHFLPLPDALKTVGDYALSGCKGLISLSFPSSVTRIGLGALMGCTSLEQVTLPFMGESRESQSQHLGFIFGAEAYTFNTGYVPESLKKVTLTEGNVPDYAFYECDRLALVTLPESCTRIGVRAFYGCDVLREMICPAALRTIGDMAFAHCVVLGKVALNEGLTNIGLQAFYDCFSLLEITLPDSLTTLPASAFAECKCLKTVTLGANMMSIGKNAFYHCYSLETATGGMTDMTVAEGNGALTRLVSPEQ
jgi:hypothetical protein